MNIHAHSTKKIGVISRPSTSRTCKLENYLDVSSLPTPPAAVDWQVKAPNALQMFMNDQIGDCAVAAYLHHKEIIAQAAGLTTSFTDATALSIYEGGTAAGNGGKGYDPSQGSGESNPTDTGLVLSDFLEYLRQQGLIYAHAEVNLANDQMVQTARYLFGGIYRAFALPVFVQNLQNVWRVPTIQENLGDATPGSWGGHCVNDKAHSPDGTIQVTSWGQTITVQPDFLKAYQTEGHIIVHNESAAAFDNFSLYNFALPDLISDLNKLKK